MRIGRCTLTRLVATGGMGAVYEAVQDSPKRTVAVKILHPSLRADKLAITRFANEAEFLAALHHPALCQVFEAGIHRNAEGGFDTPYIVMEMVEGGQNLDVYCAGKGLGVRARIELAAFVAEGVAHAHERGVIHRDLKPGNILVGADGAPKIIDFGIARAKGVLSPKNTLAGQVVGTLQYMSPEQLAGHSNEVDARSDVYALGVILYELACGHPPIDFGAGDLLGVRETWSKSARRTPTQLHPGFDRELQRVLLRATEADAEHRYASAKELAADLRRWLAGEDVLAERPRYSIRAGLRRMGRRHPVLSTWLTLVASTGVVFMSVAGVPGVFAWAQDAWLGTVLPSGAGGAPNDLAGVQIVLMDEEYDPLALAKTHGVELEGEGTRSPRRLHAQLIDRLSAAGAKSIVLDLWMGASPTDPEADTLLARSIEHARSRGVPVVVGVEDWPGADGIPTVSPAFRDLVRWGNLFMNDSTPVLLEFALRRGETTMPSLSLAAVASARMPQGVPLMDLRADEGVVEVRYFEVTPEASGNAGSIGRAVGSMDRIPIQAKRAGAEAQGKVLETDIVAYHAVTIPDADARTRRTMTYAEALESHRSATVADRIVGQVVFLADGVSDVRIASGVGGERVTAIYAHAAGVSMMLKRASLSFPRTSAQFALAFTGAVAGWLVARVGRKNRWGWMLRVGAAMLATLAIAGGSVLILRVGGLVWVPVVPCATMAVCWWGCRWFLPQRLEAV